MENIQVFARIVTPIDIEFGPVHNFISFECKGLTTGQRYSVGRRVDKDFMLNDYLCQGSKITVSGTPALSFNPEKYTYELSIIANNWTLEDSAHPELNNNEH